NYVFAALMMAFVYVVFGLPEPAGAPMVVQLMDGSPAQQAGLQLADEVISIDGKPVKDQPEVSQFINAAGGKPVEIVVLRERQEKRFAVTPAKEGERFRIGIGIEPREVWVRHPLGEELREAVMYP